MADTARRQPINLFQNNLESENCGCRLRQLSNEAGLFGASCNSAARIQPLRRDETRPFPNRGLGRHRLHKVLLQLSSSLFQFFAVASSSSKSTISLICTR